MSCSPVFALAPGVLIPLLFRPGVVDLTSLVASCGLASRRFACHARWALKPEAGSFGVLLCFGCNITTSNLLLQEIISLGNIFFIMC